MLSENLIDAIGDTPLVRLRMPGRSATKAYAKLEMHNLFAMKDRVAKNIILQARESGDLVDGAPIVESSSGTMALGVALVGSLLGHPVHIVTDPRIDRITLAKLEALGCKVHVVTEMDGHGWQGARLTRLREIMNANPGAFWPRQYENPANPAAYRTLARELMADLPRIDVLVGAVGSGGSLCGTSRVLRETFPGLRVVGVDCVGSVLFGQPDWPQRLQSGLGNSMHPPNLDLSLIDEVHWLNDREAFAATRALAREQSLFAGNTSGSVYRVMSALAARVPAGSTIVGIFPDRGDRYAGTVHSDDYWTERGLGGLPLAAAPREVPPESVVNSWSYCVYNRAEKPPATRESEPPAVRENHDRADCGQPCVAFIESNTTGSGMIALHRAGELGYQPIFLTDNPGRYAGLAETAAEVVRCDTGDIQLLRTALCSAVDTRQLAAVTTTSEFYLATAARLAAAFGLRTQSSEAIENCRNKARLRVSLAHAGVAQPAFRFVTGATEAHAAVRELSTPCVVKPADESGSTGVRRCETPEEAAAHVGDILAVRVNGRGQPRVRGALVETYVDAQEYSVEMFGDGGGHTLLGIVEKTVTGAPHFVETRHVVPADLPPETVEAMAAVVRRALQAVGLSDGASHTEVKLTESGPSVIEINPRLAGGMIPELFRLATGVDLVEQQVRQACGLPVAGPVPFTGYAGIQFLASGRVGTLQAVSGVEQARAVPGVVQVKITGVPGREVAPPVDAYGRLGYVIVYGNSRAAVCDALDEAGGLVEFEVTS